MPKNDGSRGSALYKIPLQLSERPPGSWVKLFPKIWNSPPRFTTMHRPGIASVSGDRIILNGTTMEELESYHLETLKLVVEKVNDEVTKLERAAEKRDLEGRIRHDAHRASVEDIASRLDFG